jgi:hypothetical protein
MDPNQNSKPHVFWWTQWGFKIWVHQKTWVFCALMSSGGPKNLMSIDGPRKSLNDMRFWVHQKTWGFGRVVGPSKDMRFWEGKSLKIYINLMSFDGPNGSIKRHEILKGENLDLGPSKDMRFLGPSKDMRWWKIGKIWSGPSKDMSAKYFIVSSSKLYPIAICYFT